MADADSAKDRIAFLRSLRAIRSFRSDSVPDDVIQDMLQVARWSGSARNRQPWEFVVIRNRDTLKALAALRGFAQHLAGAAVGIVLVMAGEWEEGETFDEGRLSERIMLAAAAHGLGGSIGWFGGSGRDEAKGILGIPRNRLVRTVISLGYSDEAALRRRGRIGGRRRPLSEMVRWERYR